MKLLVVSMLLAAWLAAAPAAQAQSDPKALALMAQCKAASGGAALDRPVAFHETGTIIRDGHAGTYEMYGDLHALRTAGVHTLDEKFGGGGFDGRSAWRVGPDGKVRASTDPAALADAKSGAYFTLSGFFWPDRFPATFGYVGVKTHGSTAYDVVKVTPEGATAAYLWLDAGTHRVARLSIGENPVLASGDILAERQVDGTWVGFKSHQVEDGHDMVQTLATYDYVPLDPARFDPPK